MRRSFVVLTLASFVALGVPDGMIGTAWPSMRQTIGAPIGDLGLILLAATAGAAVVSACVGALIRRLGVPAPYPGPAALWPQPGSRWHPGCG